MDATQIKVGDVVHVRVTVEALADDDGDLLVRSSRRRAHYMKPVDIVHVEPHALKVGDMTQRGQIIALHKDRAWVENQTGTWTHKLAELTPA